MYNVVFLPGEGTCGSPGLPLRLHTLSSVRRGRGPSREAAGPSSAQEHCAAPPPLGPRAVPGLGGVRSAPASPVSLQVPLPIPGEENILLRPPRQTPATPPPFSPPLPLPFCPAHVRWPRPHPCPDAPPIWPFTKFGSADPGPAAPTCAHPSSSPVYSVPANPSRPCPDRPELRPHLAPANQTRGTHSDHPRPASPTTSSHAHWLSPKRPAPPRPAARFRATDRFRALSELRLAVHPIQRPGNARPAVGEASSTRIPLEAAGAVPRAPGAPG